MPVCTVHSMVAIPGVDAGEAVDEQFRVKMGSEIRVAQKEETFLKR